MPEKEFKPTEEFEALPEKIQQKIESLVKEAYKKRKEAEEKYKEIDKLRNNEPIFEAMFGEVNMLVPIIPEEKLRQISNLTNQSVSLRIESKELIWQIYKKIVEFIEENSS